MNYSEKFNIERASTIAHIKASNAFIEKIKYNSHLLELNAIQSQKVDEILVKNQKLLHKLETNEFEIAIVGLEKAGKSTFANSLIENSVLPFAPERCTFTATRLCHGKDKATIEFYNEAEFNEIFQQLLAEIKYPEAEKASFRSLSQANFDAYFAKLEETEKELYKNHIGKTDEEIRDILKNRDKLNLTGKSMNFSGDDLTKESFQAYIKGENKGADTSKPRSVKKIEIQSSKLQKLETAVIYDVPGFDSPTKIHIRQTEERLKEADAIILVTNVGRNPSIQGTSLSVINKNTDADGIPLRDKLFVFGNQLDTANSETEAAGNKEILSNDVEKYKIGKRDKVFVGSALKYLIEKNIIEQSYTPKFEVIDGVEAIRAALIRYYETERFEILKRKIDTNKNLLRAIFEEIQSGLEVDFDINFAENEKSRITREAYKQIEQNLEEGLKNLKSELKDEIWEKKYFSLKFREDVSNFNCFNAIDEGVIQSTKKEVDESVTNDMPIQKINQAIRSKLHGKFLNDFSRLIRMMTDEKSKEIEVRILRTFTSCVLGGESSLLFDEVEESSRKLIKKLTADIAHNEGRFTYLIERFSRDVFDILISNPLFSHDRSNKFKEAEKEFRYLDNYYQNGNGTLVNMILIGENKPIVVAHNIGASAPQTGSAEAAKAALAVALATVSKGSSILVQKAILTSVESALDYFLSKESPSNSSFNPDSIASGRTPSATQEAVLAEINKDIGNLKQILQIAVVPAINLELAFTNAIDKQIKVLIDSFQGIDTDEQQIFNDFISKVVPKIRASEIDGINARIEEQKVRVALLAEMKELKL